MRRASSAYQRNWSQREAPLALGLGDRLAGLGRDHPRRLVLAADHLVGDGVQRVGALEGRLRPPGGEAARRPRRSPPRCRRASATGASPSGFSVTGLMTGARAAARRATPAPADEQSELLGTWPHPISLTLTIRPSAADFSAASARISACVHLRTRPRELRPSRPPRRRHRFRRRRPRGSARRRSRDRATALLGVASRRSA